jgi:ubiquinol-cytochrome c reductase iron-sulfur subunit
MSGHGSEIAHGGSVDPVTGEPTHGLGHELAPGLPPHELRRTDIDPRAAARAERQVATFFGVAALATVAFVVAFVAIPGDRVITIPFVGSVSASNFALGGLLGLALFCIGAGAIHWAKKLMPDVEVVAARHPLRSSDEVREETLEVFWEGADASGFAQRKIIRRSLLGAMALLPIPAVILLRDLGPLPGTRLRHTLWRKDMRIVTDVSNLPIKPEDIPVGGLVSCVPEDLQDVEEKEGTLNERAKSAIILVRMEPSEIHSQQGKNWDYQGILAYSKICTHVGCPTALYEQQTHHLLCPCHQSTFDLADSGHVVFGPAARSMPQLAITVNDDGYLVARGDFTQPVGPSFWERG